MSRLALPLIFLCSLALSQPSSVQWAPLEGAEKYELQFRTLGETKPQTKTFAGGVTEWDEELEAGIYSYRLRAIDTFGRPGKWSEAVVLPLLKAPVLTSPGSGSTAISSKIVFLWEAVALAEKYEFVLSLAGKELVREETKNLTFEWEAKDPGEYSWTVRSLVTSAPNLLSGNNQSETIQGRWLSPESDPATFRFGNLAVTPATIAKPEEEPHPQPDAAPKAEVKRRRGKPEAIRYVRLGLEWFHTEYTGRAPFALVKGDIGGFGVGTLFDAGWYSPSGFGIHARFSLASYRSGEHTVNRPSLQLLGGYSRRLGRGKVWTISALLGLEGRTFSLFLPQSAASTRQIKLGAWGPVVGINVERVLSANFVLGLLIDLHPSVTILGGGRGESNSSLRLFENLGARATLSYALAPAWNLGTGLEFTERANSYSVPLLNEVESVSNTHFGAFGTLQFNW